MGGFLAIDWISFPPERVYRTVTKQRMCLLAIVALHVTIFTYLLTAFHSLVAGANGSKDASDVDRSRWGGQLNGSEML
jgi:hypothetical protein